MKFTLDDQIAEVRREARMRRSVYPRWVTDGRITQQQADHRLGVMEAVFETLERLRADARQRVEPDLFQEAQ